MNSRETTHHYRAEGSDPSRLDIVQNMCKERSPNMMQKYKIEQWLLLRLVKGNAR